MSSSEKTALHQLNRRGRRFGPPSIGLPLSTFRDMRCLPGDFAGVGTEPPGTQKGMPGHYRRIRIEIG